VAILILLSGIYVLYKIIKLRKKNYNLKIEQEKLVHQSKVEKVKGDFQLKILTATLDGRLEERKKIASILHDNISALLSAANLHLYASKKQLKGIVPQEIEKSQSILKEASDQIRDLSHNLISAVLLKFGLGMAVQDLCEKSSNSNLIIECEHKNLSRFEQNFEIKIFNIINELLNNILKHSGANKGLIKLEQIEGNLQVVVSDNGIGFDVEKIQEKDGIGISQIEARISVLQGLFKVNSIKGGTRIFISVPIIY
jgi:signal transduction histidine kinase